MSSGIGEITIQANDLVAAGDLSGARELLGDALAGVDPRPGAASPELAEAAGLQARVLLTLGDPDSARGWAAFAYSAANRLHGGADPRTVAAAATLAAVLHRVGDHDRAARLYQEVIIELTATDGPESLRVLAAHADLATVEYALGECETARTRLQDAWELHREVYGDGHLGGIKMLARLGAMQRDCGRLSDAHEHLALARELCRVYLAADHPLAVQVAGLARASANPEHVCSDPPSAPVAEPPPPATHPGRAAPPAPPRYPPVSEPPAPRYPPAAEYSTPTGVPPDVGPPAPRQPEPVFHPPSVPTQRVAFDQSPPVPGPSSAEPFRDDPDELFRTDPDELFRTDPDEYGDDDQWWPPDVAEPGEDDVPTTTPGPAAQRAEQPSPPGMFSGAAADDLPAGNMFSGAAAGNALDLSAYPAGESGEPDGVRRVRHLPERREPAGLPAIYRPPRARRMLPIVVAGLVIVVFGTAAVIVGFVGVDDQEPAPKASASAGAAGPSAPTARGTGSPSAAASAAGSPPPAAPGAPPTGVALRDNRDSVTLSWTYPPGAEGPVVVSGGRSGQEPRAFQELPPGTSGYIVYGLNSTLNYCFTVAVVYSVDTVGRARAVCTKRPTA